MKITILVTICLLLSGCTSTVDTGTLMILNQRLSRLETNKSNTQNQKKIEIEMYVTESPETSIVNMNQEPVTRKIKLEVIEDQNGNFIIPQERIIKHYEMK